MPLQPKYTLEEKRQFAREMRHNMTRAEQVLWYKLSRNHFGFRFTRQHTLRGYIVDFYCGNLRLVIEVDGSVHDIEDQAANDEQRDRILENYGFLVLRFTNEDVLNHLTVVLSRLWDECQARRAALKAFPIRKTLNPEKNPTALRRSCVSVENMQAVATVDKSSVEPKPATAEDYRLINDAWRRLYCASSVRSTQMTGAELTTSAERAFDRDYNLSDYLKKRSESAALVVKGMQVTQPTRRQA